MPYYISNVHWFNPFGGARKSSSVLPIFSKPSWSFIYLANFFVITSDDKEKITDFIDQSNLVTGNSFRVNNIRFKANISENNKVLAREKAIENALDKAKFYSEKLDINLGKIISFEEAHPFNFPFNSTPINFGNFNSHGIPTITSTASAPPTPIAIIPKPPAFTV